jgi:metal-responsive CopG/Arc/MetJ family transcriptional regulator
MAKTTQTQFPTKLLIGFTDEQVSALDAWRREQDDLPSRSEAIRRILDERLGSKGRPKPAGKRKG